MSALLKRPRNHARDVWGKRRAQSRPILRQAAVRAEGHVNWLGVSQPEEAFALREATKLLDALDVSEDVRRETANFLTLVLGRDATVPSVAPGDADEDVLLYWKTGPMSLEVEVSSSGAHYLWARDETGEIHCLEDVDRRDIIALAKSIILRMGIRARLHNPRWRQQYVGNE